MVQFLSRIRAAGTKAQVSCAVVTFLFFLGQILIVVGVYTVVSNNSDSNSTSDLSPDVKDYNAAVADYNSGLVANWLPGTADDVELFPRNAAFVLNSSKIVVNGDAKDVSPATSSILTAQLYPDLGGYTKFNIDIALNAVDKFQQTFPSTIPMESTLTCTDNFGCTYQQMQDACLQYGGVPLYSGQGCVAAGPCGNCSYSIYLSHACIVVTSTPPFTVDSSYGSCVYPFDNTTSGQVYNNTLTTSPLFLEIRSSADPFLALQRITKGTGILNSQPSSGPSSSPKSNTSADACIAVGVVIFLSSLVGAYLVYSLTSKPSVYEPLVDVQNDDSKNVNREEGQKPPTVVGNNYGAQKNNLQTQDS